MGIPASILQNVKRKKLRWKDYRPSSYDRTKQILQAMHKRCYSTNNDSYKYYGERGITICDEWSIKKHGFKQAFKNFINDMGLQPQGMWVERLDNNGPYAPWNCAWATREEQSYNKRNTRIIFAFGESKTIGGWLTDYRCKVSKSTLRHRLKDGWQVERAITTPPQPMRIKAYGTVNIISGWAKHKSCNVAESTLYKRFRNRKRYSQYTNEELISIKHLK